MRPSVVFLLLTAAGSITLPAGRAAAIAASGITVPFFDAEGKLTHRMTAKRGVAVGALQHLQEVELVYFAANDRTTIVQKLTATEATWDDKREILTGEGPVVVATETNRLTGEGFDFSLGAAKLYIRRDFTMTNAEVQLTSDRAEVDLIVDRTGENVKVRDVKRSEAVGNLRIVVQPTAKKTYPFERATSPRAIYDGAAGTIRFPEPVRYESKGRRGVSNTLEIDLKEPVGPARR